MCHHISKQVLAAKSTEWKLNCQSLSLAQWLFHQMGCDSVPSTHLELSWSRLRVSWQDDSIPKQNILIPVLLDGIREKREALCFPSNRFFEGEQRNHSARTTDDELEPMVLLLCQRFSHDLSWFQSRLVRIKTRFVSEPEVLPMNTSFKLTASWGAR